MKPTVIANSNGAAASNNGGNVNSAGISIPINRAYANASHGSPQQPQQQPQNQPYIDGGTTSYGSPRQQQQPQPQQPQHFESAFGFDNDMDMDMNNMFPRSRIGRLHHDPFGNFGGSHFGFPQFSTLGRRGRVSGGGNNHMEHENDFFNRLPSEFRQYIPEGFGGRRPASGTPQQPQNQPQQHHQAQQLDPRYSPQPQQVDPRYAPQQQPYYQNQQEYSGLPQHIPQSPSKRLCDAAIQTEEPDGRSEVDCAPSVPRSDNLNQHGLRNTMDMGVKSAAEQDKGPRSHSAPPPEQQQQNLQYQHQQHNLQHFATQTSPPVQDNYSEGPHQQQPPQASRAYYAPQKQAHPQQKQQTPPLPQTPNGTYVRTIPIFVEGRAEPIINSHKEIPNQYAAPGVSSSAQASAESYAHLPQQPQVSHPQQQRPKPLNTQQQDKGEQQQWDTATAGVPPQTPHTLESINKIQNIQRDVLELMCKVEQFKGTRSDKEYVYLDEMLTRNLLKLDTIDTNGKDSIRLARKEAIKCIQASINVLEAKAEENARVAAGTVAIALPIQETSVLVEDNLPTTPQPVDATKIQEPIPLPPPPGGLAELEAKTNDRSFSSEAATGLDNPKIATRIESSE